MKAMMTGAWLKVGIKLLTFLQAPFHLEVLILVLNE